MEPRECLRSIQRAVPGLRIRFFRPIRDGWDFFVLEVNGEWIFRFPRRPEGIAQLKKETFFLEKAAPQLPAPVPRYEMIFWESPLPFGGYRKVAGVPLAEAREFPLSAAADLGRFLSALHSLSPEQVFLPYSGDPTEWARFWRRRIWYWEERVFAELGASLRSAVQDGVDRLWELMDFPSIRLSPIHGDLSADHILIMDGRLSGVIDWGDVRLGDPAHDFAALWYDSEETWARETARHYTGRQDPTFWERAGLYRKLAPLHGLLYALERGDRELWESNILRLKGTLGICTP